MAYVKHDWENEDTVFHTQMNHIEQGIKDVEDLANSKSSTTGTVTSVRVQATAPVTSSQNTAQSQTLNTTIALANGYGDTKNPYASKTAGTVLAAPASASGEPSFRALVASDIPTLTKSKISDFPNLATVATSGSYNDLTNKPADISITETDGDVTITQGSNSFTVSDKDKIEDALDQKANKSGTYPQLVAGTAEQLISTKVLGTDKAPYNFRTSGGSLEIGDRMNDTLIGGSVVWNQNLSEDNAVASYSKFGVTFTKGSKGFSFVTSGTYEYTAGDQNCYVYNMKSWNRVEANHKYLFTTTSKYYGIYVYTYSADGITFTGNRIGSQVSGVVVTPDKSGRYMVSIYAGNNIPNGTVMNETIYIGRFDLTLMFGSEIADYIYSLEQATAGAGVAKLKSWGFFTKGYYPYDAGTLQHVQTDEHKMVGFNAFNKDTLTRDTWINDLDGSTRATTGYHLSDYIPVVPNAIYYRTTAGSSRSLFYDAGKNVIDRGAWAVGNGTGTFTIPSNAHYIRFTVTDANLDSFCINLHWDGERDGEYEAYKERSYALDPVVLRGIPKLVSGELEYDGDWYESNGTVTRRYGIVDLGTLTWVKDNQTNNPGRFNSSGISATIRKPANNTEYGAFILCDRYVPGRNPISTPLDADKMIAIYTTGGIYLSDVAYTNNTAAEFKTAMSGVYLVYELATPTTDTAEPYVNPQVVDKWGTESYSDYAYKEGSRTFEMPVGHETAYLYSLQKPIEDFIIPVTENLPEEDGVYNLQDTVQNGVHEIAWKPDRLLDAFAHDTASGSIASFPDGAKNMPMSVKVGVEPVQDLHGYENPWPAGGGKNKWPLGDITATATNVPISLPAGTYTLSCVSSVNTASFAVRFYYNDSDSVAVGLQSQYQYKNTVTLTAPVVKCNVSATGGTATNVQLELGSEKTDFAPYSNICPITGWDGANLTRTGKNVLDAEGWESGQYDNGVWAAAPSRRTSPFVPIVPNTQYHASIDLSTLNDLAWINYNYFDANKNWLGNRVTNGDDSISGLREATFSIHDASARYLRLTCRAVSNSGKDIRAVNILAASPQLEYGSTATAFDSYKGSIPISFGSAGTVYGGSYDTQSGVLTVDKVTQVFNSFTNAQKENNGFRTNQTVSILPSTSYPELVCNMFRRATNYNEVTGAVAGHENSIGMNTSGVILLNAYVNGEYVTSMADVNALIPQEGCQITYKIKTPLTYQLDPIEIATLYGQNNVWADTGAVTVDYPADTGLYIDKRLSAIIAQIVNS